jgi:hypothetical protein
MSDYSSDKAVLPFDHSDAGIDEMIAQARKNNVSAARRVRARQVVAPKIADFLNDNDGECLIRVQGVCYYRALFQQEIEPSVFVLTTVDVVTAGAFGEVGSYKVVSRDVYNIDDMAAEEVDSESSETMRIHDAWTNYGYIVELSCMSVLTDTLNNIRENNDDKPLTSDELEMLVAL